MTYGFKNLNETEVVESASTLLGLNAEGAVVQVSAENAGGGGSSAGGGAGGYLLKINESDLTLHTTVDNVLHYYLYNVDYSALQAAISAGATVSIQKGNEAKYVTVLGIDDEDDYCQLYFIETLYASPGKIICYNVVRS